jgi:hypothetical protein
MELLKGRKELQMKIDKIDKVATKRSLIKASEINEADITDDL